MLDVSQMIPSRLNHGIATFTFDDFPESAYLSAGQIIEDYGARATYFANADFLGKTVHGITYYRRDLLRDVVAKGHEIGCHGADHVPLGTLDAKFALETVTRNAEAMRDLIGPDFRMVSFAYPFGSVSPAVKRALGQHFPFCRGVHTGFNAPFADLAQLRIVSIESARWDEKRIRSAIFDAHRNRYWLIFLSHDVSDTPTPHGSTPAMIARTLEWLSEAEVPVMTLKAAGALVAFGVERTGR